MKIELKGRPRQLLGFKVICLDTLMVEMLNCSPDLVLQYNMSHIQNARTNNTNQFIFKFSHGAVLTAGSNANEYVVYPYLVDGSDGLAAVEELKMLDALRTARKHFLAMKKACYNAGFDNIGLRVTRY